MALSWLFMGKKPSGVAAAGAFLILFGTLVSAAPQLLPSLFPAAPAPSGGGADDSGSGGAAPAPAAAAPTYWYSVVIFFTAQLFLSSEKVFEEMTFHKYTIDVFYMFFWTLVTQVTLGARRQSPARKEEKNVPLCADLGGQ